VGPGHGEAEAEAGVGVGSRRRHLVGTGRRGAARIWFGGCEACHVSVSRVARQAASGFDVELVGGRRGGPGAGRQLALLAGPGRAPRAPPPACSHSCGPAATHRRPPWPAVPAGVVTLETLLQIARRRNL
jgi:hypothetical protein